MRRVNSSTDASSASASSNGSAYQAILLKNNEDEDKDDIARSTPQFLASIFGVLFTLSKEKGETYIEYHWFLLKCAMDYWQLFSTVFSPNMGWSISQNGRLWWWISLPNFYFLKDLSFGLYVVLLYLMVALLAVNLLLCVYVAYGFHKRHFDYVWPVKVQRVFSSVFFQVFDVASLNLLQVAFSCQYTGVSDDKAGYMMLFPDRKCMDMPQLIHAIVGCATMLLFIVLALFLNMAEVEVNIYSRRPHALGHSGPEVMGFAVKALLTSVNVFIGQRRVVAVLYVLLAGYLVWIYFRWSPHFVGWVNHVKVGTFTSILYVCLILNFMVYNPGIRDHETNRVRHFRLAMTYLMVAGLIPSGFVGAFLSWIRLQRFHDRVRDAFAHASIDAKPRDIFQFHFPEDVEIAARLGRVWVCEEELDKEALMLTGNIIKVGQAQMPNSPFLLMLQANYLMGGPGFFQAAQRQIQAAAKMDPSVMVRFMLFVREQLAMQQAAGHTGAMGSQMDLVGYVEYQRKYNLVIRVHKEALMATSHFWQLLQSHRVSFKSLSNALIHIENSTRKAEHNYRSVLLEYSSNTKLLRLYARFLDTVKNDPQAAAKFYSEATKLGELHGDTDTHGDDDGMQVTLGEVSAALGGKLPDGTQVTNNENMTILANAAGIIQKANKTTTNGLGFRRGELEGKNLKGLMPMPWANKHVTYLKNYLQRGDDRVSLPSAHVVVLHRLGYGIPVNLTVVKASGLGEDSIFMGFLQPQRLRTGRCRLWVLSDGTVTCADSEFCATFGFHPLEMAGARLSKFIYKDFSGGGGDSNSNYRDKDAFSVGGERDKDKGHGLRSSVSGWGAGKGGGGVDERRKEHFGTPPRVKHREGRHRSGSLHLRDGVRLLHRQRRDFHYLVGPEEQRS